MKEIVECAGGSMTARPRGAAAAAAEDLVRAVVALFFSHTSSKHSQFCCFAFVRVCDDVFLCFAGCVCVCADSWC